MRITSFLVGLVFLGFIAIVFSSTLANLNENYNINSYDNESLETYNQLETLSDTTKDIRTESGSVNESMASGETDDEILGGLFTKGHKTLKLAGQSIDVFDTMTSESVSQIDLGDDQISSSLKTAILLSIIIMIVLGVIIAVLVRSKADI